MITPKYFSRWKSIARTLSPALLVFLSLSPQLLALEFPPADDRGAPSRSAGGGTRGPSCIDGGSLPLTALMPTRDNVGTTATTNPTLFLYVPKNNAKSAELVVVDDRGQEVYANKFPLTSSGGILKINVPHVASLQVGKNYVWQFALICDAEDRSQDRFVRGEIRPIELSSDLKQKLQQASSPLEKAKLFAGAKIWNETLSIVADLRTTYPAEWQQLLKSVGLESLAEQPIFESFQADSSQLILGNTRSANAKNVILDR